MVIELGVADLRGEGKWWWSGDPMATYSGKVHWQ